MKLSNVKKKEGDSDKDENGRLKESSFECTKSFKKFFFSKIVFYDRRFAHLSLSPSASRRTGEKRLNYQQKSSNSFFCVKTMNKRVETLSFLSKGFKLLLRYMSSHKESHKIGCYSSKQRLEVLFIIS